MILIKIFFQFRLMWWLIQIIDILSFEKENMQIYAKIYIISWAHSIESIVILPIFEWKPNKKLLLNVNVVCKNGRND